MVKDWNGNQKSIYTCIGASNHSSTEREENDFYATDPIAIDELLKYETFDKNIWECASGKNHLVNRLREYGYNVISTDLIDRGCQDKIVDFLKYNYKFMGDIITNPPYKFASEFILKALEVIPEGNKVAMFLKLTALEGQKRFNDIYSKFPPYSIYVFTKRVKCAMNGEFEKISSSAVSYAWFIWKKGFKGNTIVKWINF